MLIMWNGWAIDAQKHPQQQASCLVFPHTADQLVGAGIRMAFGGDHRPSERWWCQDTKIQVSRAGLDFAKNFFFGVEGGPLGQEVVLRGIQLLRQLDKQSAWLGIMKKVEDCSIQQAVKTYQQDRQLHVKRPLAQIPGGADPDSQTTDAEPERVDSEDDFEESTSSSASHRRTTRQARQASKGNNPPPPPPPPTPLQAQSADDSDGLVIAEDDNDGDQHYDKGDKDYEPHYSEVEVEDEEEEEDVGDDEEVVEEIPIPTSRQPSQPSQPQRTGNKRSRQSPLEPDQARKLTKISSISKKGKSLRPSPQSANTATPSTSGRSSG
jgi:hypothetical protein